MLTGVQSQSMAAGHVKCIKLHAHGACPTIFVSYAFKRSLKSIFSLISAAGDMLTGAQSQIMAVGHVKSIKLTTLA